MRLLQNMRSTASARGFTLVELMIAMALVGILTAVIYALFVGTSDAITDVQARTEALDRARFGLDVVRSDLQAAASQSTPNADIDPWFEPNDDAITFHAISGYEESKLDGQDLGDVFSGYADEQNPGADFSSFVVIGAYDIPASFFARFPELDAGQQFAIEGTERGVGRLLGYDPFDTRPRSDIDLDDLGSAIQNRAPNRLLRVTDDRGFSQILPITAVSVESGSTAWDGDHITLDVSNLQYREGDDRAGFEPTTEDDVSFDAAMLDAYHYFVREAPDDPKNLQLVRQRLNANQLVTGTDPENAAADGFPPMVVADYVADFRVWFDCTDGDAVLSDGTWGGDWEPESDDCVDTAQPENARVANIRLSTRTETENPNRPHYTLVDDWEGFEEEGGQMRTFEVVEQAEGSAGVVTVQTTVELANFAMRRL